LSQADRGAAFAALHERGCFVIPNPWDAGSARVLETLGFRALATTSSGFAFTLGRRDGGATLEELAGHVASLTDATDLPVSVDLEDGHGDAPGAIRRMAEAGAVGGSIEDWERSGSMLAPEAAAERVAAAAEAAHSLGFPFVLTARAENHIRGNADLDDTIARLQAYEAAGADVLYAPGLRTAEEIRTVCRAVSLPVNVLALGGLTVQEIADAGARRISVGGGLAWTAMNALVEAATAIRDDGDLSALVGRSPVLDDVLRT
jgi:2-methylisocitrate lyase-like PEP mutase family enzyme